jgi:hypothetical protein
MQDKELTMRRSLNIASKLAILMLFALAFGATVIALSVRGPRTSWGEGNSWGTSKKIDKQFSVQPGGLLVLDADGGDVTITGSDSQKVSADVSVRGSEDQMEKYHVDFEQDGNTIRIKGKFEHSFLHFYDQHSFEAHYELHVPKKFDLQLETSGGDIVLHSLDGHVKGETSGGDIEAKDITGTVKMNTSGGNIRLQNSSGELTMETSGGDINGKSLTGNVDVETSGGNITISESDARLTAITSGGDISVSLKDNKGLNL